LFALFALEIDEWRATSGKPADHLPPRV